MGKETDGIKAAQSDQRQAAGQDVALLVVPRTGEVVPIFQRRQQIHDAARALESGGSLPEDLRRVAAEILRQWLAIEFYGKRNLSGEFERITLSNANKTIQTVNEMHLLKESAIAGPKVLAAAKLAIQAKRLGTHKAETLVALLMEAENISPEKASSKAAEILGRNNPDAILRQYRRYKAKKASASKRTAKIR